jgi:hypothetical protein
MVASEIGPLPADLWALIGQPVPAQDAGYQPPASPPSSGPAPLQRAVQINDLSAAVVETASESQEGAAAQPGSAPDGQPEDHAASTPGGEGSPPDGADDAAPLQSAAQPDLDEIARQVYVEIKHRLQVEWERLRRKF